MHVTFPHTGSTDFNKPVIILSGNRCKSWNDKQGGADTSQHIVGKAVDFYVKGVDLKLVYEYLKGKFPNSMGIGYYPRTDSTGWIHLDVASKRRWIG